jgi:hypothetical protein
MMRRLAIGLLLLVSISCLVYSQSGFKQTIRGRVIDKASKMSLPGASVILLGSEPANGTTTDSNGNFRILNVAIGRQGIVVSFLGYKTVTIENLIITSAKETVLEIELEENAVQMKEVTVLGFAHKEQPINKMAAVSARSFTIEETEKYAGSRGDVARMASNYAGVMGADDSRNDIIIRGNSPSGLLWRLDDVDIPNPNHFAENGTTGGPVGMLNNNMLMNSDFFTGAFPAEYGNALSGVFDLKMRDGNNEKHEFLFQTGFNGFEMGAEGPLSKNHKSSYLVDARYSTLELVSKFVDFGTAGVPKYKDISFKMNFPINKGKITLFGIGGTSEIAMLDSKKTGKELYSSDGTNLYNRSSTGVIGGTYSRFLTNKTYIKFILSSLSAKGGSDIDTLDADYIPHNTIHHSYVENRASAGVVLNSKINAKFNLKSGVTYDRMGFNLKTEVFKPELNGFKWYLDSKENLFQGPSLIRGYIETSYHFTDQFTLNPGVQIMYFDLNRQTSVEPRLGVSWQVKDNQKISLGYGLQSKIQTLYTYYYLTRMPDNSYKQTNENMGFTKSNQVVLGYDLNINKDLRIKLESYYQHIFNVPVEQRSTSFSILNTGAYWGPNTTDSLVNNGTGYNYGLELTLEKFFSKSYYYLFTCSLFDSKYKGSDGVLRNTAFNGKFVLNCLLGKEFQLGNRKVLAFDFKATYAGGIRYTPIDTEASKLKGEEVRFDNLAFSKQFPNFLKIDAKVGFRLNGRKVTQEWQFYVENVTNHKNFLNQTYNVKNQEERTLYQLGFFPMVLYRINF